MYGHRPLVFLALLLAACGSSPPPRQPSSSQRVALVPASAFASASVSAPSHRDDVDPPLPRRAELVGWSVSSSLEARAAAHAVRRQASFGSCLNGPSAVDWIGWLELTVQVAPEGKTSDAQVSASAIPEELASCFVDAARKVQLDPSTAGGSLTVSIAVGRARDESRLPVFDAGHPLSKTADGTCAAARSEGLSATLCPTELGLPPRVSFDSSNRGVNILLAGAELTYAKQADRCAAQWLRGAGEPIGVGLLGVADYADIPCARFEEVHRLATACASTPNPKRVDLQFLITREDTAEVWASARTGKPGKRVSWLMDTVRSSEPPPWQTSRDKAGKALVDEANSIARTVGWSTGSFWE